LARDGDAKAWRGAAHAGRRARQARKLDRAAGGVRVLGASAEAQPDVGYALARWSWPPGAAIKPFSDSSASWSNHGYDVAAAVRRDRSLDPSSAYQIGVHFADRRHPAGRRGA